MDSKLREVLLAAVDMILAGDADDWENTTGFTWDDLQLVRHWLSTQQKD